MSALGKYTLADDGKTPIPATDLMQWAQWFEDSNKRIVRQDFFGPVMVSTAFLAIDHSWHGGPPVLWETMIFAGPLDGWQNRATTYEMALAYHADACAEVKHSQLLPIRAWLFILRISRLLRSRFATGSKKLIRLFYRR